MSFTSEVKNEISKLKTEETDRISELSAILRNIGQINDSITVTSENASVARRIFTLLKETYAITPKIIVRKGYNFTKTYIYILEIKEKVNTIVDDLSLSNIPKEYIYGDNDLLRAYIRGLFISCGSINDPKKSRYHLEFIVNNLEYANFIKKLLNEFDLNSKVIRREAKYMIYVKEAEKIGDFLRIINAINAVFYYEDIRIYRDHKNMTNRLNNCEQANVDKIIDTSSKQLGEIEKIKNIGGLNLLDDKIKIVAVYREKYPEASLLELSEIISLETGMKITKSGLYHRFKKISELAKKISN